MGVVSVMVVVNAEVGETQRQSGRLEQSWGTCVDSVKVGWETYE